MQNLNEKFLLFRVLRFRDKQAYGELYMLYAPRLRRYLTFKLPTHSEVDDVLADVFLKTWDYITISPVESLSGLLFSICRNRISDYYRSKGRREEPADLSEFQPHDDGHGAKRMEQGADAEVLRQSILRLPHDQQAVLLLRYFDGLDVDQVAEHLGKSANNVRVLSHRAIQTLKEQLKQS